MIATLSAGFVEYEVRRRIREDCGDGWLLSSHGQRLLDEAVEYGLLQAELEHYDVQDEATRVKRVCRRATDRGKYWLQRETKRRKVEGLAGRHLLALAGAVFVRHNGALVDVAQLDVVELPVLAKLELHHLAQLVTSLEKPGRAILEARYWRGETWEQIAKTVGVSVKTVRALHDSAVADLRYWVA